MNLNPEIPPGATNQGQARQGGDRDQRADAPETSQEIAALRQALARQEQELGALRARLHSLERAEELLHKSEAQYRYLFEHNPHPMWAYDQEDLRFLAVNDAAVQLYGYTRDEFLGMTILDIRPPEERGRLTRLLTRPLPELNHANVWQHQRRDGSRMEVEITSHTIELFGRRARLVVAQDVTARLTAEAALRQSDERFATIFAHSPIALSISRLSDSQITHANPAFLALYGYTYEELIGRTALDLGLWARAEDRQRMNDQLRLQQRIARFETVTRSASGVEHPVLLSGELVQINDELHVLIQLIDISTLKQAQQELQELNQTLEARVQRRTAEARELSEMLGQVNAELVLAARAKDEFLANMSHELRTPLNAILGFSESLQEQIYGPLTDGQRDAIGTIESSGRHLLTLINDILDLAKVEAGRLEIQVEPVLVQDVCHTSMVFVREQALRKHLRLDLRLNDQEAVIEVDEIRLKQILVNLLSNAVKFTPPGGAVGLEVTVDAEEGVATFTVHDTGIGIAPADLGRLFRPFSQIDPSLARESEGTGLGLALVRRLAEIHGGSVAVESEVGRGSRFTVALPYHAPVQAADALAQGGAPAAGPPELPAGAAHGRILLADDNEANVSVIARYVQARGYTVTVARDGHEALACVDRDQPDLIVIDIQMPRLDGLAVIQRLRALPAYATIPIIALTALAMPGDRERCLEAGASAYMAKPVSMRALVRTIQGLLGAAGPRARDLESKPGTG